MTAARAARRANAADTCPSGQTAAAELTAIVRNSWFKAFYDGLIARGEPAKLAMMRKLLTAIYSVTKNRKPFVRRLPATPARNPC